MSVFEIRDGFFLDGKPFQVISGSIHYFRVVPEYWRDRLLRLKAMGCNTVETYIPWNFHEPVKGTFLFEGDRDVEGFIRLAQELGLYVILRPSPYICAEWELGGLPAWLLKEDGMRLRCCHESYLRHVMDYYDELIPRLARLQVTKGGPVLMMQVENEYGSYGNDTLYMQALRDAMIARGVDVPLVTSDGPCHDMLSCGHTPGVFQTGNFGSRAEENFQVLTDWGINPPMCMEFWAGWFDHWGCGEHRQSGADCAKDFAKMLEMGHVNIYMFHGGTSFGLMNGSNYYDCLTPDVTSYDYDAALSEDGQPTEKYFQFKAAIEAHQGAPVPPVDIPPIPKKAYPPAKYLGGAALLDLMNGRKADRQAVCPLPMEKLDQAYGYILYRTTLHNEQEIANIRLTETADRAHVLLDGRHILTLYDRELNDEYTFETPVPVRPGATLDILVENLGRVNYSWKLEYQRKGIAGAVILNHHQHYYWDMYCLDEKTMLNLPVQNDSTAPQGVPAVHRLSFTVDEAGDTFLDLSAWGKGVCFLNDFALGRFWEIGPQKRLYIPAPLLKTGENTLTILETEGRIGPAEFFDQPLLG